METNTFSGHVDHVKKWSLRYKNFMKSEYPSFTQQLDEEITYERFCEICGEIVEHIESKKESGTLGIAGYF